MSDSKVVGGRYRLDERIAAGAMGAVWRGTDTLLNRTVAVKELLAAAAPATPEGITELEESRQRIHREGRIAARLQHAHVIRMFDVVVDQDRPWLVMEYLESKSLSTLINERGPMKPLDAAAIGRDIADGLAAAHAAGVVHRDVKPGNVLIGHDGRNKLTDFGVSRAVDDVQITRTGLIAGTPAFLSPEVARGASPAPAADVFALGATIYAAIEGKPPFGLDENAYALLHKVATGKINPPKHAGPLTGLLLRLLAKEPEARPTAAEARDELDELLRTGKATDYPDTPVPAAEVASGRSRSGPATLTEIEPVPAKRSGSRWRFPVLVAVVAVLLAGGGVAVGTLMRSGSGSPLAVAPPVATATPTPGASRSATPSPSASASASAAPTTTAAAPQGASTGAVAFVEQYYSLLPQNTGAAFALLSPAAQAASGGRERYDAFYGGLQSVFVRNLRANGNTVTATVSFTNANGQTSNENYVFVTGTDSDGNQVMESFARA